MTARGLGDKYQGMNWIRPERRLAIYLRDGLACAYCGQCIEDEVKLTLDHVKPWIDGGSNANENLVTACLTCNSRRSDRRLEDFAAAVASYVNHGVTAADIIAHVDAVLTRPVDVGAAKALIAKRGGFTAALRS